MFRHIKIGERIQIAGILGRLQDEIRAQRLKKKVQGTESNRYHHTLFKPIIDSQDANTDVLKQMVESKDLPQTSGPALPGNEKRDSGIDKVGKIPENRLDKQIHKVNGTYFLGQYPMTIGD